MLTTSFFRDSGTLASCYKCITDYREFIDCCKKKFAYILRNLSVIYVRIPAINAQRGITVPAVPRVIYLPSNNLSA